MSNLEKAAAAAIAAWERDGARYDTFCQRMDALRDALAAHRQAEPVSALKQYNEIRAEDPADDGGTALERLRFFCSLSMPGQDWLDVEPFFDDAEQELAKLEQQAEPVQAEPSYFGLTKDHTWLSVSKEQYDKLKPKGRMACIVRSEK